MLVNWIRQGFLFILTKDTMERNYRAFWSLFVCLLFVQLENLSLICRRHHDRWRAAYFDLWSALMAIAQWGFFSVPYLLWHGASLYKNHLRGPWYSHLLPSAWQWSCHYLFLRSRSVVAGNRTPTFRLQGERSNPLHHRYGLVVVCKGQRIAEQFYQCSLLGFHYDLTAFECDPRNQPMVLLVLL